MPQTYPIGCSTQEVGSGRGGGGGSLPLDSKHIPVSKAIGDSSSSSSLHDFSRSSPFSVYMINEVCILFAWYLLRVHLWSEAFIAI